MYENVAAPPEAPADSSQPPAVEGSSTPEANWQPAPQHNSVALPPAAPPVPEELSNSAEVVPSRRNPFQTIKEKLSPVRKKVKGLFRGYETSAETEAESEGQLFGEEPSLHQPSAEPPAFTDKSPAIETEEFDSGDFPPVPPQDSESLDTLEVTPEDSQFDVFDRPEEINEPLPFIEEDAEQDELLPPISEEDLTTPDSSELFPAPAPTPEIRPENLPNHQLDPETEPLGERFDASAPQLLRAPRAGLSSASENGTRFVPVSHEQLSGFAIPRMALCSTVRSYENFDEINRGKLRRGQQLLIYNTLRDFSCAETQTGVRTLTRSRVEVVAADGLVVARQGLGEAPDTSRTKRRDYFLTHRFTVPNNLSPGFYTLRLAVEDVVGHQTTFKELAVRVE